jgi:hypothetical protein
MCRFQAGRAEVVLGEMQGLLQRRLGTGEITGADPCAAEFQQGIDACPIMNLRLQLQRLAQQRQRVLILPETVVHRSDRRQQRRLGGRLVLQSGLETFCTRVQEFARGDLVAAVLLGIRQLEEVHQEVRDFLGANAFTLRALALFGDSVAFRGYFQGLHIGRGREGHDQQHRAQSRGHRQPMTHHELRGAV